MDYDKIVLQVGGFGPYQRRIFYLLCLPTIFTGVYTMAGVFLAAKTDFRCLLPHENLENATYQLSQNITIHTYTWDNQTNSSSQCERRDIDLLNEKTSTVKCMSFVYDKTRYKLTTTTEFDLVCENEWLRAAADSLYMVGMMLGATIFGALSDRYGRRPIFCLTIVVNMISGILVAVSPNIISYMFFRMFVASSSNGIFLIAYVIAIEMVGPKKRSMAGVGMFLSFTVGSILTTGFAYFIRNWRILQIAITFPGLTFLACWWFVPESIRWLLTKGRLEEAKDLLLKTSLKNGVELSQDTLDGMLTKYNHEHEPDVKKSTIFDLLRHPNLRRKSLLLFFNWFTINCTYYGLSWNTSNLGGDDYINFAISGLVEIPAHITVFFLMNRWGRRIVLCGSLLLAGTFLLLTTFVPGDMTWLTILLTMIGKAGITGSFNTMYIFTAEQYPTVIRNVGVGTCSTCSRIGGIIAPAIIFCSTIWKPLPLVIFGSGSLIAALLVLQLPETLNKKLPDSIEDGEQFGLKPKYRT